MKMKLAAVWVMMAFVIGFSGVANATLIDFDTSPMGSLAPDTVLKEQYSSWGVHFSAWEDSEEVNSVVTNSYALYSGNWWGNTNSGDFGPRHDILRVMFDDAANNVQWFVNSHGGNPILFQAYDDQDTLLEEFSHYSTYPNFDQVGFTSSGIARIDMLQPSDSWGWTLDNLSFNMDTNPVPEPASLFLFGTGLVGFLARRKA